MENVNVENVKITIMVLLALFAAVAVVDRFVEIVKKWRAPSTDTAKKLATDKARLDAHERAIDDLKESNHVICSGLLALLDHELHNGNGEQMERARDNLMDYLQGLIVKH